MKTRCAMYYHIIHCYNSTLANTCILDKLMNTRKLIFFIIKEMYRLVGGVLKRTLRSAILQTFIQLIIMAYSHHHHNISYTK
jgi:hypothetical protein